jgi:hypothetical protein
VSGADGGSIWSDVRKPRLLRDRKARKRVPVKLALLGLLCVLHVSVGGRLWCRCGCHHSDPGRREGSRSRVAEQRGFLGAVNMLLSRGRAKEAREAEGSSRGAGEYFW